MNSGDPLSAEHMLDGRYRVSKVLGVGGMGRVYLANDTRLANRPVAVKEMIVGDGVQEKKAIEDFAREARVLALLSHPGIPSLIDYFVETGRHYLVMEFVAGGDLQAMLDQLGTGGKLEESRVVRWARQILDVLDFLHGQNPPIVYRDLKPGNIMIDRDGRAMLIDFGIARFLPPGGRGTQIGSVGYAPPEQYMGKTEPRSDLYSLAATMHHLLTGRDPQLEPPFSFPSLLSLAPSVTQKTADVVMRALDKDVDKRPQTAREMIRALPDPGPETGRTGSGVIAAAAQRPPATMGSMETVVLTESQAISSAPTMAPVQASHAPAGPPANVSAPPAPARPASPAPLAPSAPRIPVASRPASSSVNPAVGVRSGAQPSSSPSSTMKTIILTDPVMSLPGARPSASTGSRKAAELKERAISLLGRGIKVGLKAITPAREPRNEVSRGSSTARTQDLASRRAATPIRSVAATPMRDPSSSVTAPRPGSNTVSRPPGADNTAQQQPAAATAKLVAREGLEFGIGGPRVLIGRSADPADALDIDLSSMRAAADRVSRRHAEIVRRGADYFIRDLGSLNGTYIAGRGKLGRDQLYPLKDRDQVVLGGAILQFRKV